MAPAPSGRRRTTTRANRPRFSQSGETVTTLLQDVRYGVRLLLRTPGFTLVAVATLALGIGANTAIFSVVHALLLRPLPYPAAGRLVMVFQDFSARGERADEWATPGNYVDWRADKKLFRDLAAVSGWQPSLTGVGQPEPLVGEQVTSGYFDVLGVPAALGRTFTESDMVPNAPRVAILSDALWQRRFGGERDVVGRTVMLGGDLHEIIGVMPPGFRPAVIPAAQLWRPRQLNTANPSRGAVVLRVVARIQEDLSLPQAQSAATVLAQQLEREHPDSNTKAGIRPHLPALVCRRRHPCRPLRPLRRRALRADHRLREHREPAARPRLGANTRDRRPDGARSGKAPRRSPTPDRERSAGRRWRERRTPHRRLGHCRACGNCSGDVAIGGVNQPRLDRDALRRGAHCRDWHRLWPRAGIAGITRRLQRRPSRWRARLDGNERPQHPAVTHRRGSRRLR